LDVDAVTGVVEIEVAVEITEAADARHIRMVSVTGTRLALVMPLPDGLDVLSADAKDAVTATMTAAAAADRSSPYCTKIGRSAAKWRVPLWSSAPLRCLAIYFRNYY
jgi:hypothetical protein